MRVHSNTTPRSSYSKWVFARISLLPRSSSLEPAFLGWLRHVSSKESSIVMTISSTTALRHREELGGQTNVPILHLIKPCDQKGLTRLKDPGCAVDIPAVFYSLSFAPNPEFSQVFPSQAEILEYFNNVAAKFDVYRHIVANTEWEGAYWQELTNTWLVKLKDLSTGESYYQECKILISAVGGLVNPNWFNIPGIDEFQGDIVHTARWRPEVSLREKDVIVVGNGCELQRLISIEMMLTKFSGSAAQLVPAIVDEAKSVSQFIRVSRSL